MRSSVLSRPVTVAAALALAAGFLPATAADAASPSGITREMVLTATNGIRASYASGDEPSTATTKAVRAIINRACPVNADDGDAVIQLNAIPTQAGASADGIVVYASIGNFDSSTQKECLAGVIATVDPGRTLSGSATLTAKTNPGGQTRSVTGTLTGDVAATPSIMTADGGSFSDMPTFSASGASTLTVTTPAKTVKDKKTSKQKKAAKAKYAKRLRAAKKSYAKALDRAGSSASKKAAAKKAYSARRASARAAYVYAVSDYRIVRKARTTTDSRPFTLSLLLL